MTDGRANVAAGARRLALASPAHARHNGRMDHATLSDDDRTLLQRAADWGCSGLDLRFEGGPWIGELDRLADLGYLERLEGSMGYMVSYHLTDSGRRALDEGQRSSP